LSKIGTNSGFIALTLPDSVAQNSLEFVCRIWKSLETQVKEVLNCCKQSSVVHSGGSSEDQNADGNIDRNHCINEVSGGYKKYIGS
jgi:hypothetical protein